MKTDAQSLYPGVMFETIYIKYHTNVGEIPNVDKIEVGDWVDLYTAEEVTLSQWETAMISLGVSMKLPDGYEAHLVLRSSSPKRYDIMQLNAIGIIDNSYCGDNDIWKLPVLALKDTVIPKGVRIAQFRIVEKQPSLKFVEVDSLGNKNRGGFGSTGV